MRRFTAVAKASLTRQRCCRVVVVHLVREVGIAAGEVLLEHRPDCRLVHAAQIARFAARDQRKTLVTTAESWEGWLPNSFAFRCESCCEWASWTEPLPIYAFAIEHPEAQV
jgi:hypothetical protein